ncbi:malto-oligosyltrehalose synthase, partial [Vineibacter terrae]|uniref:malto-oligosyltrehalose synthase n=1 Tax=Vineibacter terrae TaxID=2586908 RepID=UPI002E378059
KVLAPFLGKPYGDCLRDGEIALRFDPRDGRLFAAYYHHRFPLAPRTYGGVLEGSPVFHELAGYFSRALDGSRNRQATRRAVAELRHLLQERAARGDGGTTMNTLLAGFDGRHPEGRQRLHALLEQQNYRLCWWRLAADRINWRRFFDVNGLAALRAELPRVFDATHALILRLFGEGLIDGVRVDHVDGVVDPQGYCRQLRQRLEALAGRRPGDAPAGPPYVVVEKILGPGEQLRAAWQTDGTTGYDFMSEVSALQHDPAGEAALAVLWHDMANQPGDFEHAAHAAKREQLSTAFAGAFDAIAAEPIGFMAQDPTARDMSPSAVQRALGALLVHLPVYRLYGGPPLDKDDRAVLATALRGAWRRIAPPDRPALRLVARVLGRPGFLATPDRLHHLALQLQKLSAPLAAKAVEDTAFYRYGRLLSRNEVGASPSQFALSPAAFDAACRQRLKTFPDTLLATATHDHKRGEDTRARLAVLSETPQLWADTVRGWMAVNRHLHVGAGPDPADELMLYQMIVGAWPPDLQPGNGADLAAYIERLAAWQQKATREAKRRTSWQMPDARYEDACRRFLTRSLGEHVPFRDNVHQLVRRIEGAGVVNALAQALLRMTVPGVPDLYQGTELWDFSMVDPDNRRAVDFALRQRLLQHAGPAASLLANWRDGAIKQHVVARTLDLRRRRPTLFARGEYVPLQTDGPHGASVIAFARQLEDAAVVVLATRLPLRVQPDMQAALARPDLWQDTSVVLPPALRQTAWKDVLSDSALTLAASERLMPRDVLGTLPVMLLERVA